MFHLENGHVCFLPNKLSVCIYGVSPNIAKVRNLYDWEVKKDMAELPLPDL